MLTATPVFGADYYDWSTRTDRYGKPAGIFTTTPFPVDENSTTYSITNDEGTKTYVLGTLYFVDGAMADDTGDGLSLATAKKTIGAALTAAGSGNKTILIRGAHDAFDGTYYLTYTSMTTHYGTDDTHRFSLIGYGQERPIIDGSTNYCAGGCTALFGGSAVDTYNTFQRLKVQNNPRETFQFGTATHGVKTGRYLNLIDVWSYQGGYVLDTGAHTGGDSSTVLTDSTKTWTADRYIGAYVMNVTDTIAAGTSDVAGAILDNDGTTLTTSGTPAMSWNNGDSYAIYAQSNGLYFMNADYGFVHHVTVERNLGHGLKFADGSSYGVIEWNNIIDSGYWTGKTPAVFFTRGVGLDLKADYPSDADYGINNIARYNIVNGSVGHGLSIIGQSGMSVHHNEVTGWAASCNMSGSYGGVTFKGLYIANQYTSGNLYSNIIHDPDPCYTDMSATLYPYLFVNEVTNGQSSVINMFNNLFYGFSAPNGKNRNVISTGASGVTNFYNNTVYASEGDLTGNYRMLHGGTTATPGTVYRNNIFWNTGAGQTLRYYTTGPDASHTNNLYYYPSGTIGVNIGSEEGMVSGQDPLFVSLPSGAYVYGMGMIQSSSPAKNAGADLSVTFTSDHNLTSRPQGLAWDIGAYEAMVSPTLTTSAPTSVSTSTLTLNANISATGGASVTESGFAYGTDSTLATVISTTTLGAQSTGDFSGGITDLTPGTLYYFRAYAVNSVGTSTGEILSTTTLATTSPTVTTQAVSSITSTTATGNGTISATGYINPTARGVSYGLTTAYGATTTSTGDFSAEAFTSSITGLTCGTTYHVRAYATNSEGTGYGDDVTFTTSACPVAAASATTQTTSSGSSATTRMANLREIYAQNNIPCPESVCGGTAGNTSATLNTQVPSLQDQQDAGVPRDGTFDYSGSPDSSESPFITDTDRSISRSGIIPSLTSTIEVLKDLPSELFTLTTKFPELARKLKSLGIRTESDIKRVEQTKIDLPGASQVKNIPSEVVFARSGGVDHSISLNLSSGNIEQKVNTISGKTLDLSIRADKPVKEIKGYILVKNIERKQGSIKNISANSMLASVLSSVSTVNRTSQDPVKVENKLVVDEFMYTDPDKDGIYTAKVQVPKITGEYDILSVMEYKDVKLGYKEFHLTAVVDPEGYVYEPYGKNEMRVNGAKVSIFVKNSKTSSFELWNAKNYQQTNPQITDKSGSYSFLVPAGVYKISASAPGYYDYSGSEFTVNLGEGVHANISLKKKGWWARILEKLGLR